MKIQFLGTGAAEGFPAVFCNCDNCVNVRKIGESEFRTRAQVLIDGILSIDFPPDVYFHSLKYGVDLSNLKYLLVSHSHMDHFYAHDFILRGYRYAALAEPVLEIFGNSEVKKVYQECTLREMKPEVAANLSFIEIKPYSVFNIGGYKIIAFPANHSKTEQALLFYVEKDGKGYIHMHDTGRLDGGAFKFLKDNGAKADAVCLDCTFVGYTGGETARHMGIADGMLMKEKMLDAGIIDADTKIIISHFSHNANPLRINLKDIEEKYSVTAAYDGYETEI